MTTTHNPDGTVRSASGMRTELSQSPEGVLLVTVTTAGHRRLSELRDTAALAFAEDRGTAVDWPALVQTTELDPNTYAATFAMVK